MYLSIAFTDKEITFFEASAKYPDLTINYGLNKSPEEAIATIYKVLFTQGLNHLDRMKSYEVTIIFSDLGISFSEEYLTIDFTALNPESQFLSLILTFINKIIEAKKSQIKQKVVHEIKLYDCGGKLYSYQRDLSLNQLSTFFDRITLNQATIEVAYTENSSFTEHHRYSIDDQKGSDYEALLKEIQASIIANYPE